MADAPGWLNRIPAVVQVAGVDQVPAGTLNFVGCSATNVGGVLTITLTGVSIGAISGLGANVAAMLAAFSSANIRAACTDETGTGGLVFATAPTIDAPTFTGIVTMPAQRIGGTTANASTGTLNNLSLGGNRKIRFTNATAPTITGLDSTGIADGDIVYLIPVAGSLTLNHESAGSSAANRFDLRSATARTLPTAAIYGLMYDGTSARWRMMGGDYSNP